MTVTFSVLYCFRIEAFYRFCISIRKSNRIRIKFLFSLIPLYRTICKPYPSSTALHISFNLIQFKLEKIISHHVKTYRTTHTYVHESTNSAQFYGVRKKSPLAYRITIHQYLYFQYDIKINQFFCALTFISKSYVVQLKFKIIEIIVEILKF